MAEPGHKVKIKTSEEDVEGVLMPSEDEDFLVIKLDSGYNIGISKDKVEEVEDLGTAKKKREKKKKKKKKDPNLPNITILHTGGTIASRVDYETGAVVNRYSPEEILELYPELEEKANIDSKLISNISSDQMRFSHYNEMIDAVKDEIDQGVDGVIITHGTDTMHYSSAALSFAFENLSVPLLFVGSQRSSDRPSSDAFTNLMSAVTFMTETDYKGVGVCMHESMSDDACLILPGTKARKMHTSRRDAFKAINASPVAKVYPETGEIESRDKFCQPEDDLIIKRFNPKLKIGLLKVHPNMHESEFKAYSKFDGLVLELFALGHAPSVVQDKAMKEHASIAKRIEKLAKKMPVVASSQCIHGRLDMDVYSPGRELKELGVVGNHLDMTPETAFIKLSWLLSNYKKGEVKELFCENLRGEIGEAESSSSYTE